MTTGRRHGALGPDARPILLQHACLVLKHVDQGGVLLRPSLCPGPAWFATSPPICAPPLGHEVCLRVDPNLVVRDELHRLDLIAAYCLRELIVAAPEQGHCE